MKTTVRIIRAQTLPKLSVVSRANRRAARNVTPQRSRKAHVRRSA
ncbi:MAG: hypothetical protein Q8J74_01150 [Candidatus Didemnitutus sp.]|nr:hypothetical protein [Candidatus Didemnitutus sp.]